jgi:hypothetical protein
MKWPATLLLAAFLCLPDPGWAEVLWKGDFETGDISQWSGNLNGWNGAEQNITITSAPVHEGRSAARITIHPNDLFPNGHNRVELRYDGKRTKEGETTFFSWRFQLPADVQVHEDIGYWETKGPSYRQSMAFYVDPGAGGTRLGFRTNLPAPRHHWSAPVSTGDWHQIAMKIFWTQDPEKGRVSVWFDGRLVVEDAAAQTKPNNADLFLQCGIHRDSSQPAVETIFLDDAMEATSPGEVLSTGAEARAVTSGGSEN